MSSSINTQSAASAEAAKHSWLVLVAILALAVNLRPAIAAVGPLADLIENATGLRATGIGLLTALPLFFMGLGALWVGSLRTVFGEQRGISIGALLIAVACLARFWLDTGAGMILSAITVGIGIAMVQALIPAFIKRRYGTDSGRIIGFYSSAIVAGAVLAAGASAELANALGWKAALAFWGIPALLALVLWLSLQNRAANNNGQGTAAVAFWKYRRSWSLLFFFGIGTGAFMLVLAWLPPFYVALGESREYAGYLLAGFTLVELLTAVLISTYINRYPDRRGPLLASLLTVIAGLLCLQIEPLQLALPAVLLLGIGIGILFPLSLIVTVDHLDDPTQAGNLSAFVTGGGYIIAAFVPLGAGWLRDLFAELSQAWLLMTIGIAGLIVMALRYSPESYRVFRRGF